VAAAAAGTWPAHDATIITFCEAHEFRKLESFSSVLSVLLVVSIQNDNYNKYSYVIRDPNCATHRTRVRSTISGDLSNLTLSARL
jgi:hypothetical protein